MPSSFRKVMVKDEAEDTAPVVEDEVAQLILTENPFNRVKRLYQLDERNADKFMEAKICHGLTFFSSTLVGAVMFSLAGLDARHNFLAANVATVYDTKYIASRRAMDAYVFGGLKRGGKWAIITAAAVSSFSHLSQAIELYRVKTSSVNYAVSGALIGGASRVLLGPKGMAAGAFLGGYFGLVTGYAMKTAMTYGGINIEKRYYEEIKQQLEENRYYKAYSAEVADKLKLAEGGEPKPVLSSESKPPSVPDSKTPLQVTKAASAGPAVS